MLTRVINTGTSNQELLSLGTKYILEKICKLIKMVLNSLELSAEE